MQCWLLVLICCSTVQVKDHFEEAEGISVRVVRGAQGTVIDLALHPEIMQPRSQRS